MKHAVTAAIGVAMLAACGGGGDAGTILRDTAARLGEIKSAKPLTLRLAVDPRDGDEFGFVVDGAVALCTAGEKLPRIDVTYTQFAEGEQAAVQLISTGTDSFVEVEGTAYELGAEQEDDLRSACSETENGGGLAQLQVGDWVVDAAADGDDKVRGALDVVAVIADLVTAARALGGSRLRQLDADDARRIAEATEKSTFELERGDDGLLERLALEADLGFDVPEDLRRQLGDVVGAKVTFELELEGRNSQVTVDAPADPRPASELPRG